MEIAETLSTFEFELRNRKNSIIKISLISLDSGEFSEFNSQTIFIKFWSSFPANQKSAGCVDLTIFDNIMLSTVW